MEINRLTSVSARLRLMALTTRSNGALSSTTPSMSWPQVGDQRIEFARQRATPALVDVLGRYPLAPTGRNRVAQLMSIQDAALRAR